MNTPASLTGADAANAVAPALLTGGGTVDDPPDEGTLNEWITPLIWMNDFT